MYAQNNSDGVFGFPPKKQTDLDTNLVSWLMAESGDASVPYSFAPTAEDGSGGYSFESFPEELPPMDAEFPPGYVPQDTAYLDGIRRPLDAFGFPTELQMHGQRLPQTQPPFDGQEVTDRLQGSTESSSNRRNTTSTPSLAQVKNRKAQKKFRERQKAKMVNLSEEVENLRKRVANLSVENRDLGNSNMLMSKVIKMRDRQMNILKCKTDTLMRQQKQASTNGKLPELLRCSEEGESLSIERSLTVAKHLSANFPASKFANINQASMKDIWKHYVDLLSGLLINHEADPDDPATNEKIQLAVGELGEICMNAATLCPTSMCHLVANGDSAFSLPVDSDEVQSFWRGVLISLQLTPHQERLLLDLRSRFLQHLETIWKKRTLLSNRLQSYVMTKDDVLKSNLISCRLGSGVRGIFEELQDTCHTDCQYHTDFIGSFFQVVLEDLQTARVFVESFPYYPDVLQISNLVHKKHQETRQEEASQNHFSSSKSSSSMTMKQ